MKRVHAQDLYQRRIENSETSEVEGQSMMLDKPEKKTSKPAGIGRWFIDLIRAVLLVVGLPVLVIGVLVLKGGGGDHWMMTVFCVAAGGGAVWLSCALHDLK